MSDLKFIDIHTHIYPEKISAAAVSALGAFYDFPVEGNGTAAELREKSEKNGVVGCLLLAVATNARQLRRVNDTVAAEAAHARSLGRETYAFGGYHQDCENPEEEIAHALEIGLRGFKIHPDIQGVNIDDERLFPLYAACEGRVPVYFHMGDCRPQYRFSEARRLLRVLDRFPGLQVGAAHLGGYTAWEDAPLLAGHPNVWFDTSSSLWAMSAERAMELIGMLGADRCMFGTDYPVMTADSELPRFLSLPLTDGQRTAIAYENAKRFLGL